MVRTSRVMALPAGSSAWRSGSVSVARAAKTEWLRRETVMAGCWRGVHRAVVVFLGSVFGDVVAGAVIELLEPAVGDVVASGLFGRVEVVR